MDCDAQQWSVVVQLERELDVFGCNDCNKLLMVRLFKCTGHWCAEIPKPNLYSHPDAAQITIKNRIIKNI